MAVHQQTSPKLCWIAHLWCCHWLDWSALVSSPLTRETSHLYLIVDSTSKRVMSNERNPHPQTLPPKKQLMRWEVSVIFGNESAHKFTSLADLSMKRNSYRFNKTGPLKCILSYLFSSKNQAIVRPYDEIKVFWGYPPDWQFLISFVFIYYMWSFSTSPTSVQIEIPHNRNV